MNKEISNKIKELATLLKTEVNTIEKAISSQIKNLNPEEGYALLKEKQNLIDAVETIEKLKESLTENGNSKSTTVPRAKSETPKKVATPKEKAPRAGKKGKVKEQILEVLGKNPQGMSPKEIAEEIGSKPQNIHVWFSTTGKKLDEIVKNDQGKYTLAANTEKNSDSEEIKNSEEKKDESQTATETHGITGIDDPM